MLLTAQFTAIVAAPKYPWIYELKRQQYYDPIHLYLLPANINIGEGSFIIQPPTYGETHSLIGTASPSIQSRHAPSVNFLRHHPSTAYRSPDLLYSANKYVQAPLCKYRSHARELALKRLFPTADARSFLAQLT